MVSADPRSSASPRLRAFVHWAIRRGPLLWTLAVLLAIPALVRTVGLYSRLKSDVEELLPRKAPSVLALDELRARMPGIAYLGVLVDVGSEQNLPAGEKMLDDLAARVRKYPPSLVTHVRTGVQAEHDFLRANAPLYVDVADLQTVRERIEQKRDAEVSKSLDLNLEDDADEPLDFSDLEKKYKNDQVERFKDGRFSNAKLKLTLMLIEVASVSTGSELGNALMHRIKADLAELGGPDHYAPGMRIGYTGDVAIGVEELAALVSDLSVSSALVILLTLLVVLGYYRWGKSVLALLLPLLLAALYAFGLVTLPPFDVDSLNSNTAFLGSVIIGNGVNCGVIFLARYVEERRQRNRSVEDALVTAWWGARPGTVVAALAASAAYGSLVLTQFRGFHQFGIIGAIGMLSCWGMAFLLSPSLIAWLDRDDSSKRASKDFSLMAPIARFVAGHPGAVVLVAALCTALSIAKVRHLDSSFIEYDFSQLRRADSRVSGEAYWGHRMDELLGRYLTPLVMLSDDPAVTERVAEDLKASQQSGALAPYIAQVADRDDIIPPRQDEKLAVIASIRKVLTPRIRSELNSEQKDAIERYLPDDSLHPLKPEELPHSLTVGLRERDGRMDRAVLVYPRPSEATWHGDALNLITRELRKIGGKDARPAGSIPISADIISSIARDGPLATAVALAGVLLLVTAIFRFNRATLMIAGSLLLGVLWLTAAIMTLGVKVNFCNFIAFPITFGIGVDYSVNVMARYRETGDKDVFEAVRSTGGAVALCSMTTIIGYGSLLLANNRALFLFGVVAVLGEIMCLVAAVIVMPAVLAWLERRKLA